MAVLLTFQWRKENVVHTNVVRIEIHCVNKTSQTLIFQLENQILVEATKRATIE